MNQHVPLNIPFLESALVGWFLPPDMRDQETFEAYNLRAVILITLTLMAWGLLFGTIHLVFFQIFTLAAALYAGSALVVVFLTLLRVTRKVVWTANLVCGFLTFVLVWLVWHTGGVGASGTYWLILVPALASGFRTHRWATIGWFAAVVAAVVAMYAAPQFGWQPEQVLDRTWETDLYVAGSVIALLTTILAVFGIRHRIETWLHDSARRVAEQKQRAEHRLRKRHELAFENARESLQAFMEHSPVGVIAQKEAKIVYTNPAFRCLVGVGEEETLEGKNLTELASPDDVKAVEEVLAKVDELSERSSFPETEWRIRRRDGSTVPIKLNAFRATFDKEPVLVSIVRDLSEEHELRAKMMQMDRMIAVGTLSAGVAHEINNPLSFVQSNVEYLLRHLIGTDGRSLADLDEETIRETLTETLQGTTRIRSIVSDLRTFSVSGDEILEPMDVEKTLESAINMAWNQIKQRAHLARDYAGLPTIECHESGLAQVFLNLLVNAAQAIDEGAAQENTIYVSTRMTADDVIIEIRDTGKGIPDDKIDRIFDPFFSTKAQDEGMGLGLSICRNTVRRFGGQIEVESQEGQGTTFRVIVPARVTGEASQELELHDVDQANSGGRVVIVDDEPMLLRSQKRQLDSAYEVETFETARVALEELAGGEIPRLILCDLQMPDISGPEFYERLGGFGEEWRRRVVFMTGGVFTEDVRKFLDDGDFLVLEKPFSTEDLVEAIRTVDSGL